MCTVALHACTCVINWYNYMNYKLYSSAWDNIRYVNVSHMQYSVVFNYITHVAMYEDYIITATIQLL